MKILITITLLAITLFANSVPTQKEEKLSYSEQQEMIKFLEEKIKNKDYSSVFELGLVYENGILDAQGKTTIYQDKATKLYITAYENGDYRSIFKIVPLLIKKQEFDEVLKVTQKAIDNSVKNRSLLIGAVTIYGTTVLDRFGANREKIVDALYNTSLITNKELSKVPTLKFIKANLMNMVGDKQQAEVLLNEACFAKNIPTGLKRICFDTDNFLVAKDDVKKSIDSCTTCNLIEK